MKLWRIATETRTYAADDLSGLGAASKPGRWNDHNEPVLYCAPTLALAILETAAHIDDVGLPLNRFVVKIEVPDSVWTRRETTNGATLPVTWDAIPAGRASVMMGSAWLASLRTAILTVPSVIAPEEHSILINPRHPDSADITAVSVRRFEYNRLFRH